MKTLPSLANIRGICLYHRYSKIVKGYLQTKSINCNNLRHVSHTGALRGLFLPRWTGALVFCVLCVLCVPLLWCFRFQTSQVILSTGRSGRSLGHRSDGSSGSSCQASASPRLCASAQTIFLRNLCQVKICQELPHFDME